MKRIIGISAALFMLTCSTVLNETIVLTEVWGPFSSLCKDTYFIAQYQELVRQEKVIGSRLVRVYWEKEGFKRSKYFGHWKPWTLKQFNRKTDVLVTKFVFHGRGQPFWTVTPENGVIQYPGSTYTASRYGIGAEISCSATEFHDILIKVGELKRQGKDIKDNLTVTVFGKKQKSE